MDSIMVLKDTVTTFKKLLNADRCSVFKLDRENEARELPTRSPAPQRPPSPYLHPTPPPLLSQ